MAVKVLYEIDAVDLKSSDRGKRILRSTGLFVLQMALVLGLFLLIGIWAIFILILATYVFLPSPIIPVPSRYKITAKGIIIDNRSIFPLRKDYKLRFNEKRSFVSILHRWRGEIIRLYTPEPEKVTNILDKLISKLEK